MSNIRRLILITLLAVAFAYVESAIVVYLRAIFFPDGFAFPLTVLNHLSTEGRRLLMTEIGREAATMVMLVCLAGLFGRTRREGLAFWLIMFGVWDIFYYVWLNVLDPGCPMWPMTWDVLFLIPVPWVAPVIAPVVVSLTMIGTGMLILFCEQRGLILRARGFHWIGFGVGSLVIVWSFCRDYQRIVAGHPPGPFAWGLFWAGLLIAMITLAHVIYCNFRLEPS